MAELCLNLINLSARYGGSVPLPEQLDAAAAAGVELVALDGAAIQAYLEPGRNLAALADELHGRGLRCFELLFLDCDPAREDATGRRLERMRGWAEALGAQWVLTASMAELGDPLVELFGRCCDALAPAGAGLAFEFFPWAAIDSIAAADELVRRAGRPNGRFLLDSWHFFFGPDEWPSLEAAPVERIAYLQFCDSIAVAPGDLLAESETSRRLPGDGIFDLGRFAEVLRRRGFDGVVDVEVISAETRALGPRDFAHLCVERSRRYWL